MFLSIAFFTSLALVETISFIVLNLSSLNSPKSITVSPSSFAIFILHFESTAADNPTNETKKSDDEIVISLDKQSFEVKDEKDGQ